MVFALFGVHHDRLNQVLHKIRSFGPKYINKVHLVYGEYDIITEIKAHNPETSTSILKALKETEGVTTLKTYVVSDKLTDEDKLKAVIPPEPW